MNAPLKKFGQCELRDVGTKSRSRRILFIPRSMYENILISGRDRDKFDTMSRLFASLSPNGTRPLWHTLYEEFYAIEMGYDWEDEVVQSFVDLIQTSQRTSSPEIVLTRPAKNFFWRKLWKKVCRQS